MNSQEFSFHLKARRESLGYSAKRVLLWVNPHDFFAIENGMNVSLKSLLNYLECVKLELCYKRGNRASDYGHFEYGRNKSIFYSDKNDNLLFETPLIDLFGLLSFMNENGLKVRFGTVENKTFYSAQGYSHSEAWKAISQIHSTLRMAIEKSEVSIPALAKSLHISTLSLNYFLTGVVNHDFKMLEVIAKRIGHTGIYKFQTMQQCQLDVINGNLYAIREGDPMKLLKENCGKKVEDVVEFLLQSDFCYAFFPKDKYAVMEPLMKENNVDTHGKLKFDKYEKKELEELVRWRTISILRNETCDYCHSRGIAVHLYPTRDNREIQLCQYCKDRIHPTNNFVHIIYTPAGGKNKR